jgi:hypothetical protein
LDPDVPGWKMNHHFQLPTQGFDQPTQCADVPVVLGLQLRKRGLLDAQLLGDILLSQPHQLADLGQEHLRDHVFGPDLRSSTGFGGPPRLPKTPEAKEQVQKNLGYFREHEGRMNYGELRAQGYFIGSGVTAPMKCAAPQSAPLGGPTIWSYTRADLPR